MLLGAARILQQRRRELKRSVRFIFQPAEEMYPGGAAPLIAAGALDGVSSIFGLHITSQLPLNTLGTRPGPFMAGINDIRITIRGHGGHAAMPERSVDPIVVAAQVILGLQTVVSRSLGMFEAAVVSVTRVEAGTADNIIPEFVRLSGTIRTYEEPVRERVCARVRELARGIAAAAGAVAEVDLPPGYPVLVNDPRATELALQCARAVGFAEQDLARIEPQGGGEDFAIIVRKFPGRSLSWERQASRASCIPITTRGSTSKKRLCRAARRCWRNSHCAAESADEGGRYR
jgi:amidohydrolase